MKLKAAAPGFGDYCKSPQIKTNIWVIHKVKQVENIHFQKIQQEINPDKNPRNHIVVRISHSSMYIDLQPSVREQLFLTYGER